MFSRRLFDQWSVEITHRGKDVTLEEDGYTNRLDNAPGNDFSLAGFALNILKLVSHSPNRAIEHFPDDRNRPTRLFSGFHWSALAPSARYAWMPLRIRRSRTHSASRRSFIWRQRIAFINRLNALFNRVPSGAGVV
ncbi:hypothetical protein MPC4_330031 [Methylocella tundrae]|uniref:Uncharacterized protein n=1 Tax=Methylocella tundrae TaxID=227605 RepID=A0A8B6M9Q5_METTU|nr:hypothetical protein MPC1_5710004 [Methylocella tundrae]VTZ51231.1 hypothetical protein MPC4_330031 [Methylocella tundrae]